MADRYWVGGSGNWDATSTANWATSSGGASGASAPTSADNVIFDANSNTLLLPFTVTVTGTSASPSNCLDFSTSSLDGAMTLALSATSQLDCYGSMTLPATNFTWSGTAGAFVNFRATTTGKTITTNGVSVTLTALVFNGIGGEWTLGSALSLTVSSAQSIDLQRGTFRTGNYNITSSAGGIRIFATGDARAMYLGSSTITLSNTTAVWNTQSPTTNLTFDAGTSQITCSNASPTFTGGGLTFYNVSFTSAASGTTTINGANTFNNLTQTSRSATGRKIVSIGANQTVSGTLTLGAANTAIRRIFVQSDTIGTQRTITLNGTLATLADVDFRDIATAGTVGTWTGTRIGNALNNSGITFTAAKTVYWNLAGTQNWSATAWATTNNGAPAVNNFPLPQDTATFTEAGAAGTVTIDVNWWVGEIQMADGVSNRTTAFTLAFGTSTINVYKNVTLFSSLTITASDGGMELNGQGTTQTFASASVSIADLTINSPSGTAQLTANLTSASEVNLGRGTLDLSSGNRTLTCNTFSSSNSNTRSILFGTGNITVTGNAGTVWSTGLATGFTYTGTPTVNFTYSGATGTRTTAHGGTSSSGTETNSLNFNISAGSDTFTITSLSTVKNLIFTGFTGTLSNNTRTVYGNVTFSSGMTCNAGTAATTFAATSGTQQITTNGNATIDFPITQNNPGATLQLQDSLTIGSTRTFTLTNGTINVNDKTLSVGTFSTNNANTRVLAFGTNGVVSVVGSGTAFDATTSTNLSTTGTGSINMTSSSAKTFAGGGGSYKTLTQAGSGALTITGSNTFSDIKNSIQPATITFANGTTQTVSAFTASGTTGNLITINSDVAGSKFTLSKSSGVVTVTNCQISDSNAIGGAVWNAFETQGNVNTSTNYGWNFGNEFFAVLV